MIRCKVYKVNWEKPISAVTYDGSLLEFATRDARSVAPKCLYPFVVALQGIAAINSFENSPKNQDSRPACRGAAGAASTVRHLLGYNSLLRVRSHGS
jgi:hypothetical protein